MKKLYSLLAIMLLAATAMFGQQPAPGILNYQGVARNSVGNVLANKNITLRLTIHDLTATGATVYSETRTVTTNPFGLFNVQLGSPGFTAQTGSIAGVPWGVGLKFIQVEIDPNGGSSFINIGTAQLASVPYSLYSSLANDLVLPFNKTQADAGTLFKITNSGSGSGSTALEGLTNSTAANASAIIGTVTSTAPGGNSTAVRGINNGNANLGIGVWGSQNGSGWGVYGTAVSGIGGNFSSTSGFGVFGSSTSGVGVYGNSSTNRAGFFENTNSANTADALVATTNGAASSWALRATSTGLQGAGIFTYNNSAGAANAVRITNNGSGAGVFASTSGTGSAGRFDNTNAANTAPALAVNSNASLGILSSMSATTGQVSAVTGFINTTTGGSAGVGGADFSSGGASPIELRTYGVLGQTGTTGIAVGGYALTGGTALRGSGGGATGYALNTTGRLQFSGIGEAANRIMATIPGNGDATWVDPSAVGIVTGSGTLNFVPKWTPTGTNLGNSQIFDNGTNIGIGTTTPANKVEVVQSGAASAIFASRTPTSGTVAAIHGESASQSGNAFAVEGVITSTTPGGFSAGVRGINNGTGGLGIGVWGSHNGSGWGVYGTANGGIGVNGSANSGIGVNGTSNTGTGGRFTTTSGLALHTTGGVRLEGISEAAGRFLVSDAIGNATWVSIAPGGVGGGGITNFIAKWTPTGASLGNSLFFDDGTSVGLGTTTPAYRLDIEHTGSTGIRNKSTASFSVFDIDAFSGDAAIRFINNGINQWNMRNQPGTDNWQLFELSGGGERMHFENNTGNLSIGGAPDPLGYRVDILHGGSSGIRNKSSAGFSTLDIDAFSGDAALRFAVNGVNSWNIRNQPGTNNLQVFELGGGGERMHIEDGTGNISIGGAPDPLGYRLDILHGGSSGILNKSSAGFSTIDIDAFSGDAALRFVFNGVNQWNIRNQPGTNNLQFFELSGGGERMRIDDATGKVWVNGDFTALGVKLFTMDHPLDPENKTLAHAAIESNEVLNSYSGNIVTDAAGKATVTLPDYFESINKDFRYQLTVIGSFAQAIISKEISNNKFEIATNQPNIKVSWEVKGVRSDAHMQKHPFTAVQQKSAEEKGKYLDPEAHNQPASKGIGYDKNLESSLNYTMPGSTGKPVADIKGTSVEDVPASKTVSKPAADVKGTSVEDVPAAKQPSKPAQDVKGTSVEDVPVSKTVGKPVDDIKGTSVEDVKKPAENKKPVEEKKTEKPSVIKSGKTK